MRAEAIETSKGQCQPKSLSTRNGLRKAENTMATIACTRTSSFMLPALFAGVLLATTPPVYAADEGPIMLGDYVTVLTLARDGAWGTATEAFTSRAIAFAI